MNCKLSLAFLVLLLLSINDCSGKGHGGHGHGHGHGHSSGSHSHGGSHSGSSTSGSSSSSSSSGSSDSGSSHSDSGSSSGSHSDLESLDNTRSGRPYHHTHHDDNNNHAHGSNDESTEPSYFESDAFKEAQRRSDQMAAELEEYLQEFSKNKKPKKVSFTTTVLPAANDDDTGFFKAMHDDMAKTLNSLKDSMQMMGLDSKFKELEGINDSYLKEKF